MSESRPGVRSRTMTGCIRLFDRMVTRSRRKLSFEALRTIVLRVAGGWYNENIFFRWRIHYQPRWVEVLFDLALLPVALGRRLVLAMTARLELTRVEVCITTRCTLRCRDCASLIPFYESPADEPAEKLIRDVDAFLNVVDQVHSFSVMGGETFLHPHFSDVLAHLVQHPKVATVQVVTNGTIMPREPAIALLAHKKVVVAVSNYPEKLAPNKALVLARLRARGVNCVLQGTGFWKDLGGFAPVVNNTEAALERRFKRCQFHQYHNLMDGAFHLCPRSAHGARLGQFADGGEGRVIFRDRTDICRVRSEIRKLCRRRYLPACRVCLGGLQQVPSAIQLPRRTSGVGA